jgi:hypothetical protein
MLTHHDAKRVKTVAIGIALASWAFSIAVALFALKPLRPFTPVALIIGAVCMAVALLLGWTLFCPWCARRLFFVASIANSPNLTQLVRQYFPRDMPLRVAREPAAARGAVSCALAQSRSGAPSGK